MVFIILFVDDCVDLIYHVYHSMNIIIRQHGSAVYVGMAVVVCML